MSKKRREPSIYTFKIAEDESEFDQIHRLNYATFVEEIPQHEKNDDGVLVDKFHSENLYLICLRGDELAGMMALRDKRPFSLDQKLDNLDEYLPPGNQVVEIRLLSVVPSARTGRVLAGLLSLLGEIHQSRGWTLGIISGTTRQKKLYRHMGFKPFGPIVGSGGAYFQPMCIELESFEELERRLRRKSGEEKAEAVSFLPGPVRLSRDVRDALTETPISHRSSQFHELLADCQAKLCRLLRCNYAMITPGSGTVANEIIAARLKLLGQHGLILSNGEFGERIARQSQRFGLSFDCLEHGWGEPFDLKRINAELRTEKYDWLWMTACETSTGMKNDLERIAVFCAARRIKLCADCVSAAGSYPLDLRTVYLASGTSGKALRSFPGLALVFHNESFPASDQLPLQLDIGYYHKKAGVPFTQPANMIAALDTALRKTGGPGWFAGIEEKNKALRARLEEIDVEPLVGPAHASPAILTIALPPKIDSATAARSMRRHGFLIASESEYLARRNWIQIALMGELSCNDIDLMTDALSVSIIE